MAITLHTSLIIDGRIEHASLEFDAGELATVAALFEQVDRERRLGSRFFARLLQRHRQLALTVLHNGTRLKLPDGLQTPLNDGDEINLLIPVVGG